MFKLAWRIIPSPPTCNFNVSLGSAVELQSGYTWVFRKNYSRSICWHQNDLLQRKILALIHSRVPSLWFAIRTRQEILWETRPCFSDANSRSSDRWCDPWYLPRPIWTGNLWRTPTVHGRHGRALSPVQTQNTNRVKWDIFLLQAGQQLKNQCTHWTPFRKNSKNLWSPPNYVRWHKILWFHVRNKRKWKMLVMLLLFTTELNVKCWLECLILNYYNVYSWIIMFTPELLF